jgi:hypothetical protein
MWSQADGSDDGGAGGMTPESKVTALGVADRSMMVAEWAPVCARAAVACP